MADADAEAPLPAAAPPPLPDLSPEQAVIMRRILDGENVFITGSAGTGKSLLLKHLRKRLDATRKKYAVTAPTGVAALNVGGRTIHSYAGIRLGDDPAVDYIMAFLEAVGWRPSPWGNATSSTTAGRYLIDVLIIDEISMLSSVLFAKLDIIAREIRYRALERVYERNTRNEMLSHIDRNAGKPFGGIQLVIFGDFFQLPPVYKSPALAPPCWHCGVLLGDDSSDDEIELDKSEKAMGNVWRGERLGVRWCPRCQREWKARPGFAFEPDPFGCNRWDECRLTFCELTKVFRQGADLEFANILNRIRFGQCTPSDHDAITALDREVVAIDATNVVCTKLYGTNKNVDRENDMNFFKLDKTTEQKWLAVDDHNHARGAEAELSALKRDCNMPATVKMRIGAQVMLLANVDTEAGLVNGTRGVLIGYKDHCYVMVRGRDGTAVKKIMPPSKNFPLFPEVRFVTQDGSIITTTVAPFRATKTRGRPGDSHYVEAGREQIPLALAWATTIHKSQGMTISMLEIDFDRGCFAEGQAYVALSRGVSRAQMRVRNYKPECVKVNEKVLAFYDANRYAAEMNE